MPSRTNKKLYKLYKSTLPSKKWDVWVENPKTGRVKKISFGAKNYSDYTIHHDRERREQYRSRHKNDRLNDPLSAGAWSYYVLWGPSTSIKKNMNYMLRKFF